MVTQEIFFKMFLEKHKVYNLIKRKIHILTITIKKTCKHIKFIIAFYEFSYFKIGAWEFHYQYYKLHLFQCIQPNNHSFTEYRINYKTKFNFIGIKKKKKTEGIPKFFLNDRQTAHEQKWTWTCFCFCFCFFKGCTPIMHAHLRSVCGSPGTIRLTFCPLCSHF